MRLIALEVETFKKVRHALVTFGPRVTVLYGPNELGKSTLAEALRAALLVEVTKKDGEAFIPWDAPAGRARVTLTFEVDSARYRVDKTFGARPKSVLERAELSPPSTYRRVVEDRGVDGKLRELLSWGVPAPATRGASRKATSFLVTALLGQQGRAADIFEASLATDDVPSGPASGRARVTKALGAMGRDPMVEALLAKLDPRVERSFTETGRPRQTSDAPLVQAREKWSQSEDELLRLKEKDAVATEIAARLTVRMQEHESCAAEVKVRRAKLEAARAAAEREAAMRTLAEAQERLTVAAEAATAAARARDDLAQTLEAARSDLGDQRAAAEQALEAKVAAEAGRQALTYEEDRRHDTETRLAEERQRFAAVRETAHRAHAAGVARQSSAAAATDAAKRTRDGTEARLREVDKALGAAEARLADARRRPVSVPPAHPQRRSAGRRLLLTLGVGFCVVGVITCFVRAPLLVPAAAILGGLAVIVAGLRAARPAAPVATPERQVHDDVVERQVSDLTTQLADARDALTAAKVDEARTQAEFDAARSLGEQLAPALTLAREGEDSRTETPAHASAGPGTDFGARIEEADASLAAATIAVNDSRTALLLAERQVSDVETWIAAARDSLTAAKVVEAKAQAEHDNARADADERSAQLTLARKDEARAVRDEAHSALEEVLDVHVAEEAHAHSQLALDRCKADLDQSKGALQHAGGHATRERLEAQRELVADRRAAFEELEREENAAYRLFLALKNAEEARTADVGRALAKPVAARFADLTGGRYERVSLDANLTEAQVSVSGTTHNTASVSVGAREQLATLVRLALAAQLRTALLLDDQLVHSDAQRLATLRAQLLASSREHEHQIVVLTCRPADYLVPDEPDVVAIDLAEILNRP